MRAQMDERSAEETMIVSSLAAFLAARHRTGRMLLGQEQGSAFDPAVWGGLAELGLLAAGAPAQLGGAELSPPLLAAIAAELGGRITPEPFIACAVVPGALARHLPEPAARGLVDGLLMGGPLSTLCWQTSDGALGPERGGVQLDAADRLTGTARFVSCADRARTLIVAAWRGETPALVLVMAPAPGLSIATRRLGDGLTTASVVFDRVAAEPIVAGKTAVVAVRQALDLAAVCSAAYVAGLSRTVLDRTLEHLRTRVQFNRPLGAFQTLQHEATDLYMALSLMEASWRRAAALLQAAPDDAALAAASAAKARAATAAPRICRAAIQMFGGLGFAEEAELGLALRVAQQHAAWLGGRTAHLRRFADLAGLAA